MLKATQIDGNRGKILNALDFPLGQANLSPMKFTSESYAWQATKSAAYCKTDRPFPGDSVRWGMAATSGALSWFHIDSDGFGTFVDVQAGSKYWIVGRPKCVSNEAAIDHGAFSDINMYLKPYDFSSPPTDMWDFEAVYLEPGTRLYVSGPSTAYKTLITIDTESCAPTPPMQYTRRPLPSVSEATFTQHPPSSRPCSDSSIPLWPAALSPTRNSDRHGTFSDGWPCSTTWC